MGFGRKLVANQKLRGQIGSELRQGPARWGMVDLAGLGLVEKPVAQGDKTRPDAVMMR
jgi:hypothetical protein